VAPVLAIVRFLVLGDGQKGQKTFSGETRIEADRSGDGKNGGVTGRH